MNVIYLMQQLSLIINAAVIYVLDPLGPMLPKEVIIAATVYLL